MLIFSAPSGGGKTTIVKAVLKHFPQLAFSVSTTSRSQRPGEINAKDYYFISSEEFRRKIENDEFIEWQEVYPGIFYGTQKSELDRILTQGKNPVF
ncbi:MAG: guanylate kinase, partial [Bacteroidetes bacterium 38_7]